MTQWVCQFRSSNGKLYQLWHGWSDWTVLVMSNCIDYEMMGMSGQFRSCYIVPIITWLVVYDSFLHVRSDWLWYDESIRSDQVILKCTNHDMVDHIGQFWSCQIILIMTWWVCQVRSGLVKLCQSWYGWSDWTVWVMSNHIDYDMMSLSGQVQSC